jgi:hypothetical protein
MSTIDIPQSRFQSVLTHCRVRTNRRILAVARIRPKPRVEHLGLRVAYGALRPKPRVEHLGQSRMIMLGGDFDRDTLASKIAPPRHSIPNKHTARHIGQQKCLTASPKCQTRSVQSSSTGSPIRCSVRCNVRRSMPKIRAASVLFPPTCPNT